MAVDRRVLWVGATLVVAVIGVMVVRSWTETPPATAPRRAAPPGRVAAGADGDTTPPAVNLSALTAEREGPHDGGRDPFRFRARPAPPAPAPQRLPGVPDDQVGAPPVRVPTGPPPPPAITLKFIGMVQTASGTKIAVLSDGKRVIQGREGEEIEGRYTILKIGTESLDIAYIDGRGRQTIRLTGQ
jgi:hypothetical protein